MRNLTGYLKKILLLFSLSIIFPIFNSQKAIAASDFTISTDITHTITDAKINTEIIATISASSTKVLSYYTATIPIKDLSVKCYNAATNQELVCSGHNRAEATDILIDFNNAIITAAKPYSLKIIYQTSSSSTNTYNIVSTIQDTTTNTINVIYPRSKGEPLWTSDTIQGIKSIGENFQISISKPIYQTLTLLFGNQVSYKFTVSKTFTNQESSNQTFEIIVPADTPTQTILWDNINPLPTIAEIDEDGNYTFKYILSAGETLDCSIQGHILMHASLNQAENPNSYLISSTGYWNGTSSKTEFIRINKYLIDKGINIPDTFSDISTVDDNTKALIYKYLYQYVIDRLNPESNLTSGILKDTRVGFDNLVSNPNSLTPADYSDFLITILRAYKIPARQVLGFVSNVSGYTSDGFYNYWVEAYDTTQSKWLVLDPFLEDYTSKSLFNSPFFDHIAILYRGKSPISPKLTFYTDSDFKVASSTDEVLTPTFAPEANLVFENTDITSKYIKATVNISNKGNIAIAKSNIKQSSIENLIKYLDPINNINSQMVLPNQNASMQFNILNTGKLENTYITIGFSNYGYSKDIMVQSNPTESIPLYLQIITKVISIASFATVIYLVYFGVNKYINKSKKNVR